jgi:NAD(P)-dependent dehydrogenase (short-subunit alcohol dehydrogenase family)
MNTIVVTGATSGIGLETVRILTEQGNRVIGIGHCEANCERAKTDILLQNPEAQITFLLADLMQEREVLRVAQEIAECLNAESDGELFALILNAGCIRSWYTTTEEGYEQQFALNHLAGFLLTYALLPNLQKSKGRVLITGSGSHKGIQVHWDDVMLRRRYNPLTAYKQSKLCNLLFAKALNNRYPRYGVRSYVVDPGLVNTDIGNKKTGMLVNLIWSLRKRHGVLPAVPARTYAFLCDRGYLPEGLYYYHCKEAAYSKQVTAANADRLFTLSERLCGVRYPQEGNV